MKVCWGPKGRPRSGNEGVRQNLLWYHALPLPPLHPCSLIRAEPEVCGARWQQRWCKRLSCALAIFLRPPFLFSLLSCPVGTPESPGERAGRPNRRQHRHPMHPSLLSPPPAGCLGQVPPARSPDPALTSCQAYLYLLLTLSLLK